MNFISKEYVLMSNFVHKSWRVYQKSIAHATIFFLTSFIITCLLPMMSCKSQQKVFNPEDEKEEYIVFGNGGGFTETKRIRHFKKMEIYI